MMYLCVIFMPPLYFLARQKWGGFVLNSVLYSLAWLLLITLLAAVISPIFWLLAVGHAGWHLRKEMMVEHAELIATKMVEKMNQKAAGL